MLKYIFLFLFPFSLIGQPWERELMSFNEITIQGRHTATIKQGNNYKVVINSPSTNFDINKVLLIFAGERLIIKYDGNNIFKGIDIEFEIEVPSLTYIEARNNAKIEFKEFDLGNAPLTVNVAHGGFISINNLSNAWIQADISIGGTLILEGETSLAELSVKSNGKIDAQNLVAQKVNAKLSMGGEILCHAVEELQATIHSGGKILYNGSPKIEENITYRGTVEKLQK